MGADGVDVKTASVTSLLFGGIGFDTPDSLETTVADIEDLIFTLHPRYSSIEDQSYARKIQFVMYFTGSVSRAMTALPTAAVSAFALASFR